MRRIGYRRLLPVANVLLYVVLIAAGYVDVFRTVNTFSDIQATIGQSAGMEGAWQLTYIDRPRPLTHVLAEAVNFPAVLFAIPFGHFTVGWKAQLTTHSVAAVYLLILWYLVGMWLDLRNDPERVVRHTPALNFLRWFALVLASVCGIAILILLFAMLPTRLAEGAMWEQIFSLPALFWPMFLAYVAWWDLKASKAGTHMPVPTH